MEYLGFRKRESDKHHFMSAHTVSASIGFPHPPVVPPPFHVKNQFKKGTVVVRPKSAPAATPTTTLNDSCC